MAILGRTNQLSLANDFAAAPARSLNTVLLVAFALLSIGLLMMTSASVEIANSSSGDPFYYLKRQSVFALIGLAASAITLAIPLSLWRRFSFLLVLLSYILLIAVLIPGIGKSVTYRTEHCVGVALFQSIEQAECFKIRPHSFKKPPRFYLAAHGSFCHTVLFKSLYGFSKLTDINKIKSIAIFF